MTEQRADADGMTPTTPAAIPPTIPFEVRVAQAFRAVEQRMTQIDERSAQTVERIETLERHQAQNRESTKAAVEQIATRLVSLEKRVEQLTRAVEHLAVMQRRTNKIEEGIVATLEKTPRP